MTSLRRQLLVLLLSLSDLVLLGVALCVSVLGRASLMPLSVLAERTIQAHTIAALFILFFAWEASFSLMGLYRSKRLEPVWSQIAEMLMAAGWATLLLALISLIFRVQAITSVILLRFLSLAVLFLLASRLTMRQILTVVRLRGRNLRNVAVVGTNSRATDFAATLLKSPELGYRLVGFVDDAWMGPLSEQLGPSALISTIAGFRVYLRSHVIDEVVIALPVKSFYEEEESLIHTCREHGVIVRVLTNLFNTSMAANAVHEFGSGAVVTYSSVPLDTAPLLVKRSLDIVGSTVLLVLASPILLAAYVLIKLDSKGPAVFAQERVGLNKRRFQIYKLRTMVVAAEKLQADLESRNEAQGPVFKITNDPRITRVGKILRKTSIDELPQLFNVLKGDMSLVGPRPIPVRDYSGFSQDWQRRRFSVRPGITCLWQVTGRSSIGFDQWMRLDMQYIDQWSLWLDMKILARTIPAVVKGCGAV